METRQINTKPAYAEISTPIPADLNESIQVAVAHTDVVSINGVLRTVPAGHSRLPIRHDDSLTMHIIKDKNGLYVDAWPEIHRDRD